MKIVFLDQATMGDDISFESLKSMGDFISWPMTSHEDVAERICDAEVVITNKVVLGKAEIDAASSLKLICVAATGTNNVDCNYAASKGIPVKNAKGYSTESVAQVTFAHILTLLDNMFYFDEYVKNGSYSNSGVFSNVKRSFNELNTMTFGIIGMGVIGRRVASIATAFGAKVQYYSTTGTAHCKEYPMVSLEYLLNTSDILSIHSPLNEKTMNLISSDQIKLMKKSAIIVNMGRGGIVNEADLAEAIDNGTIAGAATDVYEQEPVPYDHPYLRMRKKERIILTPHVGWASVQARKRLAEIIIDNIKSVC